MKERLIVILLVMAIASPFETPNTILDSDVIVEQQKKSVVEVVEAETIDYDSYIEDVKNQIFVKASETSKTVTKEMIDIAFKVTEDEIEITEETLDEYLMLANLHIAIMEVESNFDNSLIGKNSDTLDYGIMMINETVLDYLSKNYNEEYGQMSVFNLEDNIRIGSWTIVQCYNKAKENHPDNIIWWFYAYYNRGLWFENYDWNYNQANIRSNIFIEKFNKYNQSIKEVR